MLRPLFRTLLLACSLGAGGQSSSVSDALAAARYPLQVGPKGFSGTGAQVLTAALDAAQFVAIGEDHFTREIPLFTAAVCDEMALRGLTSIAVEASLAAAKFVEADLPDRVARMAELQNRFPESVAFLNMRQELDLAAHCAAAARANGFQVWGLDQEAWGSAGWILDRMLREKPGPQARVAILQMQKDEQADAVEAARTGDSLKLYIICSTDEQIRAAQTAIDADGGPDVRRIFQELIESRRIYREHSTNAPVSQAERARLLKHNFLSSYMAAGGNSRPQCVLIKMGDTHMVSGFNELHQRDFGNFLAEQADIADTKSLHILVLGVQGQHIAFDGYKRPLRRFQAITDESDGYRWLKPAADLAMKNSWTLYDLRKMRWNRSIDLNPDWERIVYGYDLIVLAPELTPADRIE